MLGMSNSPDKYALDSHKLFYHLDRLYQWKYKDRFAVYPIYVEISPVSYCNHKCTFCALDFMRYESVKADSSLLRKLITSLSACGTKSVMYAGEGEPLLHPDLADIITHTRACGIHVGITTNGSMLTEEFSKACLKDCTFVKISVDGGPMSYSRIHGTKLDGYNKLWENIYKAVSVKKNRGLKTVIGVQAIILPDNLEDLEDMIYKAISVGVDYVVLKPYSQHLKTLHSTYKNIRYSDPFTKSVLIRLKALSTKNTPIIIRSEAIQGLNKESRTYEHCLATPYFWAYIMSNGDVYGCQCFLGEDKFKLGNIKEQTFQDIWMGTKRKELIDYISTMDISKCRLSCRMNKINEFLHKIDNPDEHSNFI